MMVTTSRGNTDRTIVAAMAVNRRVLGAVAARWEPNLFPSRWTNLVASWCVGYYKKYGRPPSRALAVSFDKWSQSKKRDQETVNRIAEFLRDLSKDAQKVRKSLNPDFVIDLAAEHFTAAKLRLLSEDLNELVEDGEVHKARALVDGFRPVDMGKGGGVNFFNDKEAVFRVFDRKTDPLIRFPGALGTFFEPAMERERFVCVEGPTSVGKSWLLQEFAVTAVEQKRRVAFFGVGDMTQDQYGTRLLMRVARRPFNATAPNRPLKIPRDMVPSASGPPQVLYDEKSFRKPMDREKAWGACKKFVEPWGDGEVFFKLSCHVNDSINVSQIRTILDGWARDGWVPDAVVVDYADVLAPLDGRAETRDQINATWKALKAMSQTYHCLVITASQTDADSYNAKALTKSNFSNDRRKNDHVDAMIGINQTEPEKDAGVYRFNYLKARDWEYGESKFLYVAGCLALARPFMYSSFGVDENP